MKGRGIAEPAATPVRNVAMLPPWASRWLYKPIHNVGTPKVKVTFSDSIRNAISAGCN